MKRKAPSEVRVLLVEDDRDSSEALASFLASLGYEVITAATVAEGFRRARENKFNLIILDNWFKESSGIELCKRIRQLDSDTPILFYSAAAYDKDIQEGLRAGAQYYVIKPHFEEFQNALTKILNPEKKR